MKRLYTFLLDGSWRTPEVIAHNPRQAKRLAMKLTDKVILDLYQTCPLGRMVFSGWKDLHCLAQIKED